MSSVCSINSCISPGVTSSNVSSNKLNGSITNDTSGGRVKTIIPEVTKDIKYWERRRRNNEAARRSREKRRMNDMNMDNRIMELAQRNKQLEQELFQMKMGNISITSSNTITHFESQQSKKSKLSPIIPSIESTKDNPPLSRVNGMVFPIFTTIKPVNSVDDVTGPSKSRGQSNSLNGNKINVHSDNNIFQTNLLTFSNIPLLSSIIATPNYNEDITTKPTLLLPPFQFPSKTLDQINVSDDFILIPSNETKVASTKIQYKTEKLILNNVNQSDINTDVSEVLDLRMKHENGGLCNLIEGLPILLETQKSKTQNMKEDVNHINNNDLCYVDEALDNSFLSMSDLSNQHLAIVKQCGQVKTKQPHKILRGSNLANGDKMNYLRSRHKSSMGTALDVRSRLHIRNEVSRVSCRENRKLQNAIVCLSNEIKLLKSIILPVVRSLSHVLPVIERSTCMSQDPPVDL